MATKWRRRRPKQRKKAYRRDGRRFFRRKVVPIIRVVLIIAAVVLVGFVGYRYAFPKVMTAIGIEWPPTTPAPATPTPSPTLPPEPMEVVDLATIQKEIIPESEAKYITDPFFFDGKVVYAAGKDANGPRYHTLYSYDTETKQNRALSNIEKVNEDFFQPQMNERWLVFLDQKTTGGGLIRAMDLNNERVFTIKEYYDGKPQITLAGDRICWTERTGSRMDKIYLYELVSGENVTLATIVDSPYGQSATNMSTDEVVWSTYGALSTSSDASDQSAIKYIRFDADVKEIETYESGLYVHNPKTNGTDRVWINQNQGPAPTLYLSRDGGEPQQIDTDVDGYGLGSDFVAYAKNEEIWIYGWGGAETYQRRVSLDGERCIFAGSSGRTVFWYVAGMNIDRDILKYIEILE